MPAYQWNPADMNFTIDATDAGFGTHDVEGFAEDTFIRAARNSDMFNVKQSADGKVSTFSKTNQTVGVVVVTLEDASPSNAFLDDLAAHDEETSKAIVAIQGKDGNGNERLSDNKCRIQVIPSVEKGTEAGTRSWAFVCHNLEINVRGATQV